MLAPVPQTRKTRARRTAKATSRTSSPRTRASTPVETEIYAVVRAVPRGRVATYGEIAELAGIPLGHRVVAKAMRSCPETLAWYRVIGKKDARRGGINIADREHAEIQRARLEAEGVRFDENGYISLARFGMLHEKRAPRRR
jgi:methylated-DNA-protein-cysteine methyltransferase related protein